MKKNIKSLFFSVALVIVIIGIVGGGTYAYFQWTTGEEQKTSVNVTIEMGGITMHIEPEKTEFVGLYPTADCTTNSVYGDALVTIVNNTGTMAIPSFKLKVRVTKGGSDALTQEALDHIHYSVVPVSIFEMDGETYRNAPSCKDYEKMSLSESAGFFSGVNAISATGTFKDVATDATWSHIPSGPSCDENDVCTSDGYLSRQYFPGGGVPVGITFGAPQYATTQQYFRVYLWMDKDYTSTIFGTDVTDPLQNAKIEVSWSENSMIQQVVA